MGFDSLKSTLAELISYSRGRAPLLQKRVAPDNVWRIPDLTSSYAESRAPSLAQQMEKNETTGPDGERVMTAEEMPMGGGEEQHGWWDGRLEKLQIQDREARL